MGELLDRAARQQALLDAWHDLRAEARQEGRLDAHFAAFEHQAAQRLATIANQLRQGTWQPSPVRRVAIPKPAGGQRVLGVPVLEDRVVERAVLRVVDTVIDPELLPWSFGYRRGLGVADALRCLTEARDEGAPWVARGDFSRCFDEIPRDRLLDRLAKVVPDAELVDLIRDLAHRPVEGGPQHSVKGLHQGSALSPVLTNLYLDQFDRTMLDGGWQVIRYADDYAVPVADRVAGDAAVRAAQRAAADLGLALSPQKCSVRSFDEGVPFLGQVVTSGTGQRTERRSHPHATTVFVAEEPNGLLRSRGSRLRLERGGELVFSVAFPRVRQVVVFGRVGMTTPFLQQVLIRGIDVVLLSDHGRYIGRLQGATATNPFVRQRQYEAERTSARRRDLAQRIVRGKIVNLRVGLLRARRRAEQPSFTRRIDRMGELLDSVSGAGSLASLMGVEGAATRDYFAGLTQLIAAEWGFTHRRRRPPPDPFNSLLSLGYTPLLQETIAALEVAGLDPYVGFLHEARVGRPGLALDLIEEFRPVIVDSVALRAVNTEMLRPEHFTFDPGPPVSCLLTNEGRKLYLAAYERRMLTLMSHPGAHRRVSYRVALSLQARALADELLGQAARYEPLVWK